MAGAQQIVVLRWTILALLASLRADACSLLELPPAELPASLGGQKPPLGDVLDRGAPEGRAGWTRDADAKRSRAEDVPHGSTIFENRAATTSVTDPCNKTTLKGKRSAFEIEMHHRTTLFFEDAPNESKSF